MEILYLYIEKYKALEKAEFNFSLDVNFYLKNKKLIVTDIENHLDENFFDEKISNVNAIVGKNGAGKSTLLEVLRILFSGQYNKLKTSFIIAVKRKSEESNSHNIYIERFGFNEIHLENQSTKSPSFTELDIFDSPSAPPLANHKAIYYSNFFDGTIETDYLGKSISTNHFQNKSRENSGDYTTYWYQEVQRTIEYFAHNPIYIDDEGFNIPKYISLTVNGDFELYSDVDLKGEDEVDPIITFLKKELKEQPHKIILYFYLAFFIKVRRSVVKERLDDKFEKEKIFYQPNKLLSDDSKTVLVFLYQYIIRISFPLQHATWTKVLPEIVHYLISKNTSDLLSIDLKKSNSQSLLDLMRNISLFQFSHFIPFRYSWQIEKGGNEINLSAGEKSYYALFSRLSSRTIPKRKHLTYTLLLDEPTLTMHPEWERKFISTLISQIPQIFNNVHNKSIQIIITAHSPFILSDLPDKCVTYLGREKETQTKTFAANIHELLLDSFFMKDGLVGEFAKRKVMDVIDHLRSDKKENPNFTSEYVYYLINMIGEPTVRGKLLDEYLRIYDISGINRIAKLQREIDNIRSENND